MLRTPLPEGKFCCPESSCATSCLPPPSSLGEQARSPSLGRRAPSTLEGRSLLPGIGRHRALPFWRASAIVRHRAVRRPASTALPLHFRKVSVVAQHLATPCLIPGYKRCRRTMSYDCSWYTVFKRRRRPTTADSVAVTRGQPS